MTIALVPARLGSKRLLEKNLQKLETLSLVESAVIRALQAEVFDEVWVSTESAEIANIAERQGARIHPRDPSLAGDDATSEDYIGDFLAKVSCDYLVQVHSIAPLVSSKRIREFVQWYRDRDLETAISINQIQLECVFKGVATNFSFGVKENSQDLVPVQRLNWALTAWKSSTFMLARQQEVCATYSGRLDYFPISETESVVVKTEEDLVLVRALLSSERYSELPR